MILSNHHSQRKTIQSSSAAPNANRKPFLMKKESPMDHRLHVVKNEAKPRTYRSGSHNQLTLKTSASLADKGKKHSDIHKLKKQIDNLVHQQSVVPPNNFRHKTQSSSVSANAKWKPPFEMDHQDNGENKKAKIGTSGWVSHHPLMLKARVSPTDKEKKNYDTHKKKENNKKMVSPSSNCFCGICFDLKPASDMFKGSKCNHPFCVDCISKHVAAKIQQNILKVNCPNPMCNVKLKAKYLQPILPKEVIDRWELAKLESSIDLSQKFYCPFKDCSVLLVNDGDGGNVVISSECPYCHRLFCAQCKVPWHAKMSCKEFRRLKRSEGGKNLDRKFLELAKRKMWQKCPKCSFYVQRHNGCEHMTCRCGRNFCYKCGKDWRHGHLCNSHQST